MPSGPKNQKFTNRHAEEARERETVASAQKRQQQRQEAEDAAWRDDDKLGQRRAERDAAKEQKALELQERKEARRAEEAREDNELLKKPPKAVSKREQQRLMASLVRNYDMEARLSAQSSESADLATRQSRAREEPPLRDGNPNREPQAAVVTPEATVRASGISGSVGALESILGKPKVEDRSIGRRARAAYKKFEEANLEALKQERPGMRRTQYNDLLWAIWQKSPENPFVQRAVQRADEAIQRKWCQAEEEPSDDEEEAAP